MQTLGIYIPTWNRPHLLNRLLESIEPQLTPQLQVFVSVNKSEATYTLPKWVQSRHTRINIGGDPNIITGPTMLYTDYAWVIGDDEQMQPNAIALTLDAIQNKPGLIIQPSVNHPLHMPYGQTFSTYGEFCQQIMTRKIGWLIAAHTLISSTVFRRTAYDVALALQKMDSRYGFHYGMLTNLFNEPVHFLPEPTMLYGKEASIFLHDQKTIDEHMAAYPQVIYDIFDWIEANTGVHIPRNMWKHGFDTY